MKRIKRLSKLIFMFVLAVFSINVVKAAGISVSTTSLNVRQGSNNTFVINGIEITGRVNIVSSDPSVATVSQSSVWLEYPGALSATISVTGVSNGYATITVSSQTLSDTNGVELPYQEYVIQVNVTTPSNNSALSSLSVSNCSINFNPSVTSYDCGDLTAFNSVTISATAADPKSTVSGTGTKTLSYGQRSFNVVVTAESGGQSTYTIRYRKDDNRSGIATLNSLSVVGYPFDFRSDFSGPYTITVPYKVESITIEGEATDPSTSRISGLGTFDLPNIGENRFEVAVTAENGVVVTYTIIVMRSDVENVPSTSLISLSVNGSLLDLSKNAKTFLVGVDNDVNELELAYETVSNTTTYQVSGNNSLRDGINIITIKATDTGVNTSTYTLIVNKARTGSYIVDNLNNIRDFNRDVTYNTLKYQNPVIDDDIIKLLKDSSKDLIYNVTNENKGLLYSITFNKNSDLSGALEPYFSRVSDSEVTYSTNIPANCRIKLYADNNFENGQEVKVYSFDESTEQYTLVTTAKVDDYYLEFDTDGAAKYVLSTTELKNTSKGAGANFNIFTIILIVLVILCLGFIILLVLKNKKLATNGPAVTPSIDDNARIGAKGINEIKEVKETPKKKEENKVEEIVPDFKPVEPTKGLYASMNKESSINDSNPFAEKKEEKKVVSEDIKPFEPINVAPIKEEKDLISKDINKYSSLEAEIRKNMLEDEKEKKELKPIEPLSGEESRLSSYTVDLTSIEDEIRRHRFENEVFDKAHGTDEKISNHALKKDHKDAIVLPTIDEEIARHGKGGTGSRLKSSDEIDDFFKKKDKDIVKVIDSKPYPNSKPSRERKLSDTAILPIIDENGNVKKSKNTEQDDF